MHWCGECRGPTFSHGTVNACLYQTTVALLVVVFVVTQAAWQMRKIRLLERFRFHRGQQTGALHRSWLLFSAFVLLQAYNTSCCAVVKWQRVKRGKRVICYACSTGNVAWMTVTALFTALAVSHLGTLIFELVAGAGRVPFAVVSDAAFVSAWTVAVVSTYLSRKHNVALRWRLLPCLAAVAFAGSLYISVRAWHASTQGRKQQRLPHAGVHAIASTAQLALAIAVAVVDFVG